MIKFLSTFANIIAAIAAVITATAAWIGVTTWKKQLKYGKHISIIWECMEAIRAFRDYHDTWYVYAYADSNNSLLKSELLPIQADLQEASLEKIKHRFNSLDKIVVKNDFQWRNYASDLEREVVLINSLLTQNKEDPIGAIALNSQLVVRNTKLKEMVLFLDFALEELESSYQ